MSELIKNYNEKGNVEFEKLKQDILGLETNDQGTVKNFIRESNQALSVRIKEQENSRRERIEQEALRLKKQHDENQRSFKPSWATGQPVRSPEQMKIDAAPYLKDAEHNINKQDRQELMVREAKILQDVRKVVDDLSRRREQQGQEPVKDATNSADGLKKRFEGYRRNNPDRDFDRER